MGDIMAFPDTVDEFMEEHKMVDTKQVYSNGIEFVPIFRMKQWFLEHPPADVRPVVRGEWIGEDCSYWKHAVWGAYPVNRIRYKCSVCGRTENKKEPFCNCGADMRGRDDEDE